MCEGAALTALSGRAEKAVWLRGQGGCQDTALGIKGTWEALIPGVCSALTWGAGNLMIIHSLETPMEDLSVILHCNSWLKHGHHLTSEATNEHITSTSPKTDK